MNLDVRGSLKNTRINKNYYVVIDELLSNAIDSYLIRKDAEDNAPSLEVYFSIELFNKDLVGQSHDLKISCTDTLHLNCVTAIGQKQTFGLLNYQGS